MKSFLVLSFLDPRSRYLLVFRFRLRTVDTVATAVMSEAVLADASGLKIGQEIDMALTTPATADATQSSSLAAGRAHLSHRISLLQSANLNQK